MDQPLERPSLEPEEALLVDVIRPLFRFYWLVLAFAVAGALMAFGLSYSEPVTYATESMMVVDGSYADQKLIGDLVKDQGASVNTLSSGLIRLTLSTASREDATRRLNAIMENTQVRLMGLLPDYESDLVLVKEQYLETVSLANEAKTLEQRVIISNLVVEKLRQMNSLVGRERNKKNALRIVKMATVPVASAPPDYIGRVGLGAAFGLMLGALGAYILYYRKTLVKLRKAI